MWKIEKGKRVENGEDILYSLNVLAGFDNLIKLGVVPENRIFGYYNQIMALPKEDRVPELESLLKQVEIQRFVDKGTISEQLANKIFAIMEKGKCSYKFDIEKQTFECISDIEKENNSEDELLNEDTVLALYKIAKELPLNSYERYKGFMELLCFDDKDRANEVNTAYNNLAIESLIKRKILSEDEGEKIMESIGKSSLLENWRSVLKDEEDDEFEEDEEEFEDENVAEDTV